MPRDERCRELEREADDQKYCDFCQSTSIIMILTIESGDEDEDDEDEDDEEKELLETMRDVFGSKRSSCSPGMAE